LSDTNQKNFKKKICFYFATGVERGASIKGMPNVPKKIVCESINMAPFF
jgi:hypothetical protein